MKKSKLLFLPILLSLLFFATKFYSQGYGEWTWIKGDTTYGYIGNYGVKGISSPSNNPPTIYEGFEWTDLDGNFWLFGGVSTNGLENALWKFDPLTNDWTWINGSSTSNSSGIYGVQGIPSPLNTPGARGYGGISWVDLNGDLWLFGGVGIDEFGGSWGLNDLWRYNISSNQWTWMKGANDVNLISLIIGTKGIANAANTPNDRQETNAGVTDGLGNLWLFGGVSSAGYAYNDVWKYNITTNMWTWVSGNQTQTNNPNYGTINVSAASNDPGDRFCYTKFIDSNNNMYFLGSTINNLYGSNTIDIWKFNPTSAEWTWSGGTNITNDTGSYLNKCENLSDDKPNAKFELRASWSDSCGFFFFGGLTSILTADSSYNDLWYYNFELNKFTWISGNSSPNTVGSYGNIGISSPNNLPPSRGGSLPFKDKQSNLWLYGGLTFRPVPRYQSDLWRYKLDPNCTKLCSKSTFTTYVNSDTTSNEVYIPNVFTPNGDASNNLFNIRAINYNSFTVSIFDRWGLKIFESSDLNIQWNGKKNNIGENCSEGTYYYVIQLIDKNNKKTNYKGFLSLFR